MLDQAARLAEFDPNAAARLYLADMAARDMQSYLGRGRKHEGLPPEELRARLIDCYRDWAANPSGRAEIKAIDDLLAELEIRGQAFPAADVADYFGVVQRAAKAAFAARRDEDKNRLGEAIMDCWMAAGARQ